MTGPDPAEQHGAVGVTACDFQGRVATGTAAPPCSSREFTLEEASDYVMRTLKQHSEEAHQERN